ncbi:MAG TPA: hypothetical protein VEH54_06010 [Steroidobacteraceae bacterium]|nr:hypothetical protein [Steroidobacteraceae bacterium]
MHLNAPLALGVLALFAAALPRAGDADPEPATTRAAHGGGCLPGGEGYLRARIRGALNLDIDWHNAEMECAGGPRADGSGLRLSFAGPERGGGRRLRMVFGVDAVREGRAGQHLPTNLTVFFEGEERLFATRGEDRCTVDELHQERLGALGGPKRSYRIIGRGFCTSPASALGGDARILVQRFDFAGQALFEDAAPESAAPPKS